MVKTKKVMKDRLNLHPAEKILFYKKINCAATIAANTV